MYLLKLSKNDLDKYKNKKNRKLAYYDPSSKSFYGDGYIVHKVCYNLLKTIYGMFTFNNVFLGKTDHKYSEKYQEQETLWVNYFLENDEYLLESPLNNIKNKKRILKLILPIHKEFKNRSKSEFKTGSKYENRPSPPYSAKLYPDKKKKGNDGNMWKSTKNIKGIYKWTKI